MSEQAKRTLARAWSAAGAVLTWGWTALLALCAVFLLWVGADLIVRAARTNADPEIHTAARLQALAAAGERLAFHLEITEATPQRTRLWTHQWTVRGKPQIIHYLPLAPGMTQDAEGLESVAAGRAAVILRMTSAQLEALQRQPTETYRGMLLKELDPVAAEREAARAQFGPELFNSLPVIAYGETPNRLGDVGGGVMNILFGVGLGCWAVWQRRGWRARKAL